MMMHMTRMVMVRRRKHLLQSREVDDDACKIGIDGEDDANDDVDGAMVDFVINWDVEQLIGDAEYLFVCKNIKYCTRHRSRISKQSECHDILTAPIFYFTFINPIIPSSFIDQY